MSQFGADGMGKLGFTSDQILAHFYPGTELKTLYP
jgi:peptidoglycan hydrolase-like amidase